MGKTNKAILVDIIDPNTKIEEAEKRLAELESLVNTFGGVVVVKTIQKRGLPDYETYIGKGKVTEIFELAKEHKASTLVVNNLLKPRQIFNLNEKLREADMEAWDRVDLILKIFSKHAQTTEAKLQIELAGIRHMGPRIFDMGKELMQQGGAVGLRSGQGETNTEMMKRHLRKQELNILKKLKQYESIKQGHRKRRRRKNYKTAALVGYTNAGKSSLLNILTNKGAYAADELFATLDTRIGKLYFAGTEKIEANGCYTPGKEILLSDTIGFIQNLPPSLIKAFKSTLSETLEADILLHIIDINDPEIHMKIQVVEEILEQLDIHNKDKIYIFNKVDLIAHHNVFECKDLHRPSGTLLKAGRNTPDLLGWTNNKEKNDKAIAKMQELSQKYSKHKPVFISTNEKMNLDLLRKILENEA